MIKIFSRVDPSLLLHIIHRRTDFEQERNDLVESENFLQCAAMMLQKGKTFKAHSHVLKDELPHEVWAQEGWVIISGSVRCILYDIDNTIIDCPVLQAGDCSITLMGGHNYKVLQESRVLEFKSGPYYGQEKDKTFII